MLFLGFLYLNGYFESLQIDFWSKSISSCCLSNTHNPGTIGLNHWVWQFSAVPNDKPFIQFRKYVNIYRINCTYHIAAATISGVPRYLKYSIKYIILPFISFRWVILDRILFLISNSNSIPSAIRKNISEKPTDYGNADELLPWKGK